MHSVFIPELSGSVIIYTTGGETSTATRTSKLRNAAAEMEAQKFTPKNPSFIINLNPNMSRSYRPVRIIKLQISFSLSSFSITLLIISLII